MTIDPTDKAEPLDTGAVLAAIKDAATPTAALLAAFGVKAVDKPVKAKPTDVPGDAPKS